MNVRPLGVTGNAPGSTLAILRATVLGPLQQGPGRTVLAIIAIALGVALGFSVYLINRVAADEIQSASRSLFGAAEDVTIGAWGGVKFIVSQIKRYNSSIGVCFS